MGLFYYSEDIRKPDTEYEKIVQYYLLKDNYGHADLAALFKDFPSAHPHVLAYTYDEIEAYDIYARQYHTNRHKECGNEVERLDHGILGGIKVFDRLTKRIVNQKNSPLQLTAAENKSLIYSKIACLTIAQHNIFKSNSIDKDKEYGPALRKLHSDSSFRISMDTPLLLLLSLVDTFECVKRLGKQNSKGSYLQMNTILENIGVEIDGAEISIYYKNLSDHIARKQKKDGELEKNYDGYLSGVAGIGSWTSMIADRFEPDLIHIRL